MLQSKTQTPKLEKSNSLKSKDSGYDSAESSDNISLDSDSALDSERYSFCKTRCKIGWANFAIALSLPDGFGKIAYFGLSHNRA